jgi:hypothetical protein
MGFGKSRCSIRRRLVVRAKADGFYKCWPPWKWHRKSSRRWHRIATSHMPVLQRFGEQSVGPLRMSPATVIMRKASVAIGKVSMDLRP